MSHNLLRRALFGGVLVSAAVIIPALPAQAVSTGPTIKAVHRNGAVDVPGNGSFGSVAKLSLPAGNWSITATATVQSVDAVAAAACQLVAGKEHNDVDVTPTGAGVGSYAAVVILLGHHFAKAGAVTLNCLSTGFAGDLLVRDVHVTAIEVGQLTDNAGTFGTTSPRAYYAQNDTLRGWSTTATQNVQQLSLPAGTWLVQADAWGYGGASGDRVDCALSSSSSTGDQFVGDFQGSNARAVALDAVFTLANADQISITCHDSAGAWDILSSALSAIKLGTLNYGPFVGRSDTTGTGSPTVVGRYSDDAAGVPTGTAPQSIGQASLGAGSWFAISKLSLLAAASAKTTCQLQIGGTKDQGRAYLDTSSFMIDWLSMSETKHLTASDFATVACVQSAGTNQVAYWHIRTFAIKAGSLTDTLIE
jgi:hypothetical protein